MRKPNTKGDPRFNRLRDIVRRAMSDTKLIEWDTDPAVAYTASWQWDKLNKVFRGLGIYNVFEDHDA